MNVALVVGCCAVFALANAAAAAPVPVDKFERTLVSGHEYVRVRDWAAANRMTVAWPQPGKTVRVAGGTNSVALTGDSRAAVINGIKVWLSFPPVVREDKAYVALLDLKTTIVPLLQPAPASGTIRLVALDPGHGGKDKGYLRRTQYEKNYTLALALEVRDQLTRAGLRSTLTRSSDAFVDVSNRPELARQRRADLFVSLHFNSAGEGNNAVKGVEVYCATPVGASSTNARGLGADHGPVAGNLENDRSVLLAWHLQKSLVTRLGLEDRGVKRARFEVLSAAAMPAVLIEGGFLSNPDESANIANPTFRRQMAKSIVDGLLNYQRSLEPPPASPRRK